MLDPFIKDMKKDSQDETFIGDMVRREVISVVSKASKTAPNPEKLRILPTFFGNFLMKFGKIAFFERKFAVFRTDSDENLSEFHKISTNMI